MAKQWKCPVCGITLIDDCDYDDETGQILNLKYVCDDNECHFGHITTEAGKLVYYGKNGKKLKPNGEEI
jgi:formylmethanofuran dehydrogenase subunit B